MRSIRYHLATLALVLAPAAALAASPVNLVANGDFEAAEPDVTGWSTSAGIFVQRTSADWGSATPHSGLVYTDGSFDTLGLLSQSLSTLAGAKYTLEFDLFRLGDGGTADNQAKVWFGNTVLLDEANISADWTHYTFAGLSAAGASTLLQFGLRSADSYYPALDNVSVVMTAVPEPAAALMLAAGLSLLALRRRLHPERSAHGSSLYR